ncbi:MAG: hypothetical protein TRG1_1487 [Flavobacteriaceae bacterium FS1-H7996/R]|nr:MAG: hypothetical protein TRG1_1487 [Flavobacteriaceae bacterium FS1-H7996/R]
MQVPKMHLSYLINQSYNLFAIEIKTVYNLLIIFIHWY